MKKEIQTYVKHLQKTFDTKKVADQREIGQIYYNEIEKCYIGHINPTFGGVSISIKWDRVTGKSNLTSNTDLILLKDMV